MTKKGRRNPPNVSGELNPRHKLSFKQVQQIRMLRQSGVDARLLAAGYGITRTQVYNIARRHSWKEN
jgi:DNA invertase Pin-like site-specific DNA recombinase